MLQKLKNDYISVREALNYLLNRKLPVVVSIIFYTVMLPFGLLMYPFAKIWAMIIMRRIKKEMGSI